MTGDPILDRAHLSRQTVGDTGLEQELLGLFAGQCAALLPVIRHPHGPTDRLEAAHALRGAALAVGAGQVAALSGAIETACDAEQLGEVPLQLVRDLERAVDRVRTAINEDERRAA